MDGVLLIDKPAGKSSHDVVAAVRREYPRGTKVGHSGTLDPFATGLLLVLVGRATRAQRFLMALPKSYRVRARLAATSTTGDPEGEITFTGMFPPEPLALPTGTFLQRPPAYSAVRVDGERAYARARRGEVVEMAPRSVEVSRFELIARDGDEARFEIDCSSGTYVRCLIADLGDAYCLELRRTAIGPFSVEEADPARPLALEQALAFMPEVSLGPDDARRAGHGVAVPGVATAAIVRLTDAHGLVALAEPRNGPAGSELKPVVGFRG